MPFAQILKCIVLGKICTITADQGTIKGTFHSQSQVLGHSNNDENF